METSSKRKTSPASSRQIIEDFLGLSQRILRVTAWESTRIDLLKEISRAVQEVSSCDLVELCVEEEESQYYWKADFNAQDTFSYKVMPRVYCDIGDKLSIIEIDPDTPGFCISLLRKQLMQNLPFVTPNGTFWTGNADNPNIFKNIEGEHGQIKVHIGKGYNSIALMPFKINEENWGVLQLKSLRNYHFTETEIEFFEGVAQTLGLTFAYRRARVAIGERVKELTCLYGISQLVSQPSHTLDELMLSFVELIPPAMKFPHLAMARILFEDKSFATSDFQLTRFIRSSHMIVNGEPRGSLQVVYRDEEPRFVTDPFLKEEEKLLDTVAREISFVIEERESARLKARLQEQLRHADRLATIGQLAAGVAHELNEPLAGILGFAELVKKSGDLSRQSEDDMERIIKASLHAREVVRKLLIFARQMPVQNQTSNLNRVIKEGLYFLESRLSKEAIELELKLKENIPEINVDPSQVHQVIVNLTVNAIQSMPDGGKLIISTDIDNGFVTMQVEDTGCGINKELLSQIFNPFYTTKDVGQGTGLGLSVVHGIVTSHGGSINVISEPEKGTCFVVSFPVVK